MGDAELFPPKGTCAIEIVDHNGILLHAKHCGILLAYFEEPQVADEYSIGYPIKTSQSAKKIRAGHIKVKVLKRTMSFSCWPGYFGETDKPFVWKQAVGSLLLTCELVKGGLRGVELLVKHKKKKP